MTSESQSSPFFIGWDVGGWNCDRNANSRDAIIILDSKLTIVGKPWRGNLRNAINEGSNTREWIRKLFFHCEADSPRTAINITLAIDTPLGFPKDFIGLVTRLRHVKSVENSDTNPYLYRQTERNLFEQGLKPLSAIKDMIGSQATKGMHVLAKFTPDSVSCGVWTDGDMLTAIEAYPSACKESASITALRQRFLSLQHEDEEHALTCALIAYLFAERREMLVAPDMTVSKSEGWIWVPKDVVTKQ
ncbi:MAG: hypothetical protein WB870_04295 [Gallionellaceae bacterium]